MPLLDEHPLSDELEAFAVGRVDDTRFTVVEEHVAVCADCEAIVSRISGDTFTALLRSARSLSDTPMSLATGATVGPIGAGKVTGAWAPPMTEGPPDLPTALTNNPRYCPIQQLGSGGMGAVWLAEHTVMKRHVAVKVIRPEYLTRPGAAERFQREMQVAARLHHPNIVTAFDAERSGDSYLLAMEYIDGVSLADYLRQKGPLPIVEACDCIRQAALGLQYAHEQGLIHRDLKPHNLMRTPDGTVKILDFGLAAVVDQRQAPGGITGSNVIMGTPDYLAPEQAEDARTADVRSDIYALGCTLYHLLAGQVPFPHESVVNKLIAHRQDAPPALHVARPEIPAELAAVVEKMMAKAPAARYQTAAEVVAALETCTRTRIPAPPKRNRWLTAAAALFLVGVVTALGVVVYRIQTDKGELVITTESDDVEVLVKQGGKLVEIIDTKTKKKITLRSGVYDLELKGGEGLKLDPTEATLIRGGTVLARIRRRQSITDNGSTDTSDDKVGEVRQFVGHANQIVPVAFSPDGRIILTGACIDSSGTPGDCFVQLWDLATGKELRRLKGHRGGIPSAAFSRDGQRVVAGGYDPDPSIIVWNVKSGEVLHRFTNKPASTVYNVGFSRDGLYVFTCGYDPVRRASTLRMWNLETGKEEENHFNEHARMLRGLAVSHDGRLLACCPYNDASEIRLWEIETGKLIKQFPRAKNAGEGINSIVFSPDDSQLISGDYVFSLRLWDVRTGKEIPRFHVHGEVVFGVDISPDGRQVACCYGRTVGLWDLETGKEIHRFTGHTLNACNVAFSPDSKYILSSSGDNTARLWRLPDQPAPENASTVFRKRWDAGTPNYGVDLSPDGRLLISMHGSGVKVWDVAAGKVVYDLPGFYAGFTVDGKQFVVAGKPDEQGDCLGVFDTDTGKLVRRFAKFKNHVIVLFVCPDGRTVLAGSDDRPNQLFDYTTGEQRPSGTEALGWTAIWGSKDMLDFKERTMVFPEYVLPGGTDVMGRNLVDERAIGIYQTSSGNLVRKVIVPGSGRINQIFTSARYGRRNGNRIAIALPDGTIHVMDLVSGKEVARFSAGNFTPKIMVISADDRFLAACASGEKSDVVVWRLPAQAKENP